MKYQVHTADVVEWAKSYTGPKFHSLLSDTPYCLDSIKKRFGKPGSAPAQFGTDGAFSRASAGFMGMEWDTEVAFAPETWQALGSLLLPGAFLLAYGGTRTFHRLVTAIEAAGFEIRDSLAWSYGAGQPHSKNQRGEFEGWGSGLKPAIEMICVARKPFDTTVERNMQEHGTGALNIANSRVNNRWPANLILAHNHDCRVIGTKEVPGYKINQWTDNAHPFGGGAGHEYQTIEVESSTALDWECTEGCAVKMMNAQGYGTEPENFFFQTDYRLESVEPFQYVSKPSPDERRAGLDAKSIHPTLKPISLSKYLAGLLLPPARFSPRRLLVPFSGAGSEMIGGMLAGWDEVEGCELMSEYAAESLNRCAWWEQQATVTGTAEPAAILAAQRSQKPGLHQPGLF
jgi:site-specific DNA-methyltransferase (adenine-specific)